MGRKAKPGPLEEAYDIKITFRKGSNKFRINARQEEHDENPFEGDFDIPEDFDFSGLPWRRYNGESISVYIRKKGQYHSFGIIPSEQLCQRLEKMIQTAYSSIK